MSKKNKVEVKKTISKLPAGDMRKTATDYAIPRFGFKSSFVIVVAAVFSTIILPAVLATIGLHFNLVAILSNTLITSYAVAYSRYFIESNKGFCKGFWYTYLGFAISCFVIGFFWISFKIFM